MIPRAINLVFIQLQLIVKHHDTPSEVVLVSFQSRERPKLEMRIFVEGSDRLTIDLPVDAAQRKR